jgi:peptidoglycan/LPS O-acetylase OafA/YrhL
MNLEKSTETVLRPTAWLDGLRGVAALLVTLNHVVYDYHYYDNPYHPGPYPKNDPEINWTSAFQLPIIRIFHEGALMVCIFYVISGYVLSVRKIQAIRNGDFERLSDMIYTSAVRRPFRLFVPMYIAMFLTKICEGLGIYGGGHGLWWTIGQWGKLVSHLPDMSYFIDLPCIANYGFAQFWTIPTEFGCSMVLFLLAMAVSRMPFAFRLSVVASLMTERFFSGHWAMSLFMAGWLIAETEAVYSSSTTTTLPSEITYLSATPVVQMEMEEESPPWYSNSRIAQRFSRLPSFSIVCWSIGFFFSLILGSYARKNGKLDPMIGWLRFIIPPAYEADMRKNIAPLTLSAMLMTKSIFRVPQLQGIFTTRIAIYLGEVSYSVYCVHNMVQYSLRPRVDRFISAYMRTDGNDHFNRTLQTIIQIITSTFVEFWVADLWWRWIDGPAVKFTKWVSVRARGK